jgi:hypothetical protein
VPELYISSYPNNLSILMNRFQLKCTSSNTETCNGHITMADPLPLWHGECWSPAYILYLIRICAEHVLSPWQSWYLMQTCYLTAMENAGDYCTPLHLCHCSLILGCFLATTRHSLKNGVSWDVTPCASCKNRRFGGT